MFRYSTVAERVDYSSKTKALGLTPTQSYNDLQGYYSPSKFYILSLFFIKQST